MENTNAIKLVTQIQKNISQKKFEANEIVSELKKIREISLQEKNPTITKALRLAYEHIDSNKAFYISIPGENENEDLETEYTTENDLDSFNYFLSLLLDQTKKNNVLDLKAYNEALINY